MRSAGEIERLDTALASLAREETAVRLRLGQLLEALGRGPVFDLGFSSLGAYAVERCERSVRWAEGARCLARRVEVLPGLRRAMAVGEVSWSMGELLARVSTPADEHGWLESARSRTVRQVRGLVAEAVAARRESAKGAAARAAPGGESAAHGETGSPATANGACGVHAADDGVGNLQSGSEDACTLTCRVDVEDAWLFEATRSLLAQLGERDALAQSEALLAEAHGTLLALLPKDAADLDGLPGSGLGKQPWLERLRRWREEAEASCEKHIIGDLRSARGAGSEAAAHRFTVALAATLGMTPLEHASGTELDQQVRALAATLARHELELSRLVLRLHRANGWRKLGYATEGQYARERLGASHSSLVSRRALALRLETLPAVAAALGAAHIGVAAALELVRIATPATEAAWVDRARRRTIKHLREEVSAALVAVRVAGERDCLPPEDAEISAFQKLEQAVVSGRLNQPRRANDDAASIPRDEPTSEARRPWRVMLGSLASWLESGLQMSAAPARRGPGRVTVRLRLSREAYTLWHGLEAQARRWLPPGTSWLRFMCLSVWRAWGHLLGTDSAYGRIFIRDCFRCGSPVCNRRDVTPHHLVFRSAGGSDEDHNIKSVCVWCHLKGVHGGRIRAQGTAAQIRWELGPRGSPCLTVQGRERLVA